MVLRWMRGALLLTSGFAGICSAQIPEQTVQWAASPAKSGVKQGSTATLELSADVREGWHVYALAQPAGGPTALRVTLDDNPVARLAGAPSGTPPEQRHDPSFDLDTRFYTQSFAVHVPVYVKRQATAGRQLIPLSVRFQTCSDRECQPPRTAHISVPVDVLPNT